MSETKIGAYIIIGVLTWRASDALGGLFTSPSTAAAMWLATGVVLVGVLGILFMGADSARDGIRAALLDRWGPSRTIVDAPGRIVDYDSESAKTRRLLADASRLEEQARRERFERERRERQTLDGPGVPRFDSNGFSGVPMESTRPTWTAGQ